MLEIPNGPHAVKSFEVCPQFDVKNYIKSYLEFKIQQLLKPYNCIYLIESLF